MSDENGGVVSGEREIVYVYIYIYMCVCVCVCVLLCAIVGANI